MHRKIIVLLLSTISMTSCATPSKQEGLVIKITSEYEKMERNKHGLLLVGSGSAIPDKIHAFILHFYSNQSLEQDQVRRLVVVLAEDLIDIVTKNAEIQEYLVNQPFNENNYELRISFKDLNNKIQEPPNVAYVVLKKGKISYFYHDNISDSYLIDQTRDETYEEALCIVRQEK